MGVLVAVVRSQTGGQRGAVPVSVWMSTEDVYPIYDSSRAKLGSLSLSK